MSAREAARAVARQTLPSQWPQATQLGLVDGLASGLVGHELVRAQPPHLRSGETTEHQAEDAETTENEYIHIPYGSTRLAPRAKEILAPSRARIKQLGNSSSGLVIDAGYAAALKRH